MEEEIKYLSREECIKQLVDECRFYQEGGIYKISKISSQMVTHKSRKLLGDSIQLYTQNYKGNSTAERLYWLFYNIDNLPTCEYCHKTIIQFNGFNSGYSRYCSQICVGLGSEEQRRKTVNERYPNGEGIKHNPKQVKKTKLERYGDENYTNPLKAKQTCLDTYGVKNVFHIPRVIVEKEKTCMERYGTKTPFHSPIIQKQIRDNLFEKEGVINISQLDEIKQKKREKRENRTEEEKEITREKCKQNSKNKTREEKQKQLDKNRITYFNKTGYYHQSQNPNSGIFTRGTKTKYHPNFDNIYYQSSNEFLFLNLINDLNLNKYIKKGPSIKYKHENRRYYIVDYILEYNKDNKYLIEIKATHQYFYKDLWNGVLLAKWEASEKYCENNNYKNYIFILNNKITSKQEIIDDIMIPYFLKNYPLL